VIDGTVLDRLELAGKELEGKGCLLCGQQPEILARCFPDTGFLARGGITGTIEVWYPICGICARFSNHIERCEARVAEMFLIGGRLTCGR